MRTRRKPRYSWLPALGEETNTDVLPEGEFFAPLTGTFFLNTLTPRFIEVIGLTWDYPTEVEENVADGIPSLADFQGSEYQLERTVGKFFARLRNTAVDQGLAGSQRVLLSLSFIILKVEELGGTPLRADLFEYSALVSQNIPDPWMFRRLWILGSGEYITQSAIPVVRPSGLPQCTMDYHDIESGPHFDIRTVRRVRREERVFAVVEAFPLDEFFAPIIPNEGDDNVAVDFMLDYRLLGRLVKASARGNTSR